MSNLSADIMSTDKFMSVYHKKCVQASMDRHVHLNALADINYEVR